MTVAQAYHRLTRVNGQKFTMPTAYTPEGKRVTLLTHSRFHRLRFHKVQGTNSLLDLRLEEYWEERRTQALFRRTLADARQLQRYLLRRQNYRCAITGLPLEDLVGDHFSVEECSCIGSPGVITPPGGTHEEVHRYPDR